MSQLARNSYFKNLLADEIFSGEPAKVEGDYNALKVSVQTDVSGVLSVFQSIDGANYETYGDVFNVTTNTHRQIHIKGRYVYVKYENGSDDTTNFSLYSVLSKTVATTSSGAVGLQEVLVTNDYLDVSGAVSVNGLLFDASGNLKVSGISGGGSGGDVNVTNTLLAVKDISAIEQMTIETDRLLYDLDIIANRLHDISGSVEISNAELSVRDASAIELLSQIADGITVDVGTVEVSGNVYDATRLTVVDVSAVEKLVTIAGYLDAGISVSVSNAELSVRDASAIELLSQIADGIVVQVGQVDISGVSPVDGKLPTLDASAVSLLEGIYIATGNTELNTMPVAYSPVHLDLETQGATVWADSTVDWTAPENGENGWLYQNTTQGGANAYFYSNTSLVAGGIEPDFTLGSLTNMAFVANYRLLLDSNPNKKFYIALTTKPLGDGNDYLPGVFRSRKVYQLPPATVISKGADYLFYAMLDISSFHRDLDHKEMSLAIQNGLCGSSEIVQFMSINVDSGTTVNQFSGILKEAYFSTAGGTNRKVVFDNSIARKADLALSKLSVEMGTLQVNMGGFTFNGDDELQVTMPTNTNIKCNDAFLTHTVADTKNCLDVTVNNQLTDFATETTLAAINAQTEKLTFVDTDTSNNLKVIDLALNEQLSQFSFFTNDDTVTDLRVKQMGTVEVINPDGVNLAVTESNPITGFALETSLQDVYSRLHDISGTVAIAGGIAISDLSVNVLNSSLDVHAYASPNGSTWHHLASDANGRIITQSRTHDGSGNDITSTAVSGTETYRALDVKCRGTTSVSGGVSATLYTTAPLTSTLSGSGDSINSLDVAVKNDVAVKATQYGSYGNLANNVATILPAGVTSGIDVSAWSYFVGAYQDFYSGVAPTGSLRLQYSFDNTTYYDLFNTTINPSGVGTPRTATIQKQDIPAINWIRFKNDTNQTMASVTITLLGASLS
jgi:hypothetical protein